TSTISCHRGATASRPRVAEHLRTRSAIGGNAATLSAVGQRARWLRARRKEVSGSLRYGCGLLVSFGAKHPQPSGTAWTEHRRLHSRGPATGAADIVQGQ